MTVNSEVQNNADPLHDPGSMTATWTTVNFGEALPGVSTPLGWTWFRGGMELGAKGGFADMGAIPKKEVRLSADPDDRVFGVFYGRVAGNLSFMRRMGDQMPGSSGDAIEAKFFPSSTTVATGSPTTRNLHRAAIVAMKLPVNLSRTKRKLGRLETVIDSWWTAAVKPNTTQTVDDARMYFGQAQEYYREALRAHALISMIAGACFDQLQRICSAADKSGLELRLVKNDEDVHEGKTIADLWDVAHGLIPLGEFLARHGYHGPNEGELSSWSWREDQRTLQPLLQVYQNMEQKPSGFSARGEPDRRSAEDELFRAVGPVRRQLARRVLTACRVYVPLRENGRAAFLKTYDVARCMARRIGHLLVEDGVLADPEDVFYLTVDELLGQVPPNVEDIVALRRNRRTEYLRLEVPERWIGQPEPIVTGEPIADSGDETRSSERLIGLGVSPGLAEGRALVVASADDPIDDITSDHILVCHTTDPGWASFFYAVAACVIDVGGPMSHGAIVARELNIPCVINTREGTRRIHTGDRVRVDGSSGVVEILRPSGYAQAQ